MSQTRAGATSGPIWAACFLGFAFGCAGVSTSSGEAGGAGVKGSAGGPSGGAGGAAAAGAAGTPGGSGMGSTDARPWTNGIAPLHTEGRFFKDPNGGTVVLRGVAIADPLDIDNRASGKTALQLVDLVSDASQNFHARVVRITVYPQIWLPDPKTYFDQHLKPLVDHATSLGLYVVVDWHEISDVAPVNERVAAFWTFMAPQFATYTNVLYEVFNEPMDMANTSWTLFKSYAQPWVDLIRNFAPHNIVLVGGPFWDQQIAGAATDPLNGTNLAYVGHIYPISASQLLFDSSPIAEAAAARPVIITEWGYHLGAADPSNGDQATFGDPLKAFVEARALSWTAWCADTVWEPVMFAPDWTVLRGEGYMGGFVQDWLAEKKDVDQPTRAVPPAP